VLAKLQQVNQARQNQAAKARPGTATHGGIAGTAPVRATMPTERHPPSNMQPAQEHVEHPAPVNVNPQKGAAYRQLLHRAQHHRTGTHSVYAKHWSHNGQAASAGQSSGGSDVATQQHAATGGDMTAFPAAAHNTAATGFVIVQRQSEAQPAKAADTLKHLLPDNQPNAWGADGTSMRRATLLDSAGGADGLNADMVLGGGLPAACMANAASDSHQHGFTVQADHAGLAEGKPGPTTHKVVSLVALDGNMSSGSSPARLRYQATQALAAADPFARPYPALEAHLLGAGPLHALRPAGYSQFGRQLPHSHLTPLSPQHGRIAKSRSTVGTKTRAATASKPSTGKCCGTVHFCMCTTCQNNVVCQPNKVCHSYVMYTSDGYVQARML
jgi:hypothetical protein